MSTRARRGLAIIVVSLVGLGAASLAYLRLSPAPADHSPGPAFLPFSSAGSTIASISFADAMHGAVSFSAALGPAGSGGLYLTADGAGHWRRARLPASVTWQIAYLDDRRVIVAALDGRVPAGQTWTTGDFGTTWSRLPLPPAPAQPFVAGAPQFSDALHALLLWQLGTAAGTLHPVRLWRTEDGGRHWRRLPARGVPDTGTKTVTCLDQLHCLLEVDQPGSGWPALLGSSDGGATWQPVPGLQPPATMYTGFDVLLLHRDNDAALVAEPAEPGSPSQAYVALSTDRGGTWSPLFTGPVAQYLVAGDNLYTWYGGSIWTSPHGDGTWQLEPSTFPGAGSGMGLDAVAGGVLFASAVRYTDGRPLLLSSRDGGRHWEPLSLPA